MIISYSELFKFQTCKRQYQYSFGLGLRPLEESGPIALGSAGHKLLQVLYELLREGKTKEEALATVTRKAKEFSAIEGTGLVDFNMLKAWTLVENYIRDTDFTNEVELVENRFLIPINSIISEEEAGMHANELDDVQVGFTPDLVCKRKGNKLDIEDAKFVARAWSKSKLNRYAQLKLYQIFLKRMGYDISRTVLRFFNTTTGDISTRAYTLTPAEEENLIYDFVQGAAELVQFKRYSDPALVNSAPRTMNYTACQFCAFEFPCSLEAEGKDASKTLENLYKKNDYDYSS